MKITSKNAEHLLELVGEIKERAEEFKELCREAKTPREYELFKYNCLGHLEPAISEDHEWFVKYSGITTLEKIAEDAAEDAESPTCKKCGSPLDGLDYESASTVAAFHPCPSARRCSGAKKDCA